MLKVVCFTGHAQNGKDTSADAMEKFLGQRGYKTKRVSFAQKLKDDATYLGWDGKKDDKGRKLLQELGDVIKDYHGDTYFTEYLIQEIIKEAKNGVDVILLTDMRFKQEMELFEKLPERYPDVISGVDIVRVIRPKDDTWDDGLTEEARRHKSEVDLDDVDFKTVIYNDGSLKDLEDKLVTIYTSQFPTIEGSLSEFLSDMENTIKMMSFL